MTDCNKCKYAEWDVEGAYGGDIPFVCDCRKCCDMNDKDCPEYEEIEVRD